MRKIILNKKLMPKLHIKIERYKYHLGLDCYVSNFGNIKDKEGNLQTVCKKNGYLWYRGKAVHRLVMEVWKPTPNYMDLTVDHINHNTCQNDIWNLRYMTEEDNKAQDKLDRQLNAPKADCTEDKQSTESKNEKPIGYVLLNGAEVKLSTARTIMYNDKSIGGARSHIDKLFNQIENGVSEGKYGNYVLKRVA